MAESKKKPSKKPNRTGKAVNVWISDDVHGAMMKYIEAQRFPPRKTDFIEAAVAEFLQREGFMGADEKKK